MDKYLLHITTTDEWQQYQHQTLYEAPSLANEGFIHCSTFKQVVGVVNQWFKGQQELLLLVIDSSKLKSPLKYEDLYNHGDEFPHLYGPLHTAAVISTVTWQANATGTFDLPNELQEFSKPS